MRCPPCDELEREDRVPRLQRREVHGHVRLSTGVRLDVRVLRAEELLRPVDRELLDLVDDLAAAVVAPARVALRVLVRGHAAHRLEHGRPREVLRGDELDLAPLALELALEKRGDLRIDVCEARPSAAARASAASSPCRGMLLRRCQTQCLTLAVSRVDTRTCAEASSAATAPSRRTAGSSPVRSTTVEAVPGSSPPSRAARTPARISVGHLVESARVASSVQVRARRRDDADAREHSAAPPATSGTRTPIVSGLLPASQRQPARRVRQRRG